MEERIEGREEEGKICGKSIDQLLWQQEQRKIYWQRKTVGGLFDVSPHGTRTTQGQAESAGQLEA